MLDPKRATDPSSIHRYLTINERVSLCLRCVAGIASAEYKAKFGHDP